ncbi:MAG TPA: glutamate--tRNA ligase [Solirubrobacterales bacterium]|jgi:glutamyl-tRNA synthetase|nr:glutamate--tRNA ligase [Solirubrobacterales bacterium]
MTNENPRLRFAPSPTGALHIGGARTALYNWLGARHEGGALVLRIEDTDRERSTAANVEQILDALRWLELDWDEGPISQASLAAAHAESLQRLLESGAAYRDAATAKDVEAWKAEHGAGSGYRGTPTTEAGAAIRLRVPDTGETVVEDLIRGPVSFPNRSYDDFVIARGDGSVLYNFAVAVDDAEMGITDVVRGDDHLSNTPKQLLVLAALGHEPPRYAHLPLLHGPDGKKLSKRHGAASVQELRAAGYLPAAVRNYLALLGWGTDDDTTLMSTEELVRRFRVADVGKAAAIFDEKKLRWLNGRFMRELPLDDYTAAVALHLDREPDSQLRAACEIAQEKAQTLDEVWSLIRFLFEDPIDDPKAWAKVMKDDSGAMLEAAAAVLATTEPFEPDSIEVALAPVLERFGVKPGKLYQPIRVAITGSSVSPGIFESLAALGRERSVKRVETAVARLVGATKMDE